MVNRNYHKEYERDKNKKKIISVQVTPELFEAFTAKSEADGIAKNAILKICIEAYTKDNLIVNKSGKIKLVEK